LPVLVTAVEATPLRSLAQARVELTPGIVSLVGPNGAGKTNFLEALYFALTGRSFRTADRRDLIPFGGSFARAEAIVRDGDGTTRRLLASVSRTEGRRHLLDGSPADPPTLLRNRPPVAVFSPDRLALIKGPPAERRAHLDRFVAARWPTRADLRQRFGQALAQRNALLARLAADRGAFADLDVWDTALADVAGALVAAREEAATELAGPFGEAAEELGLEGPAAIEYAPRAAGSAEEIRAGLAARRAADLRLGRSSWGPHLDELKIATAGRSLRRYGSQGQQRTALLALLFAERDALLEAGRVTPLLLLDDVMSELDPGRRERLMERLARGGQTLITAASEDSLPSSARGKVVRMPLTAIEAAAAA
jgi:DNA replication and repair protein RecF